MAGLDFPQLAVEIPCLAYFSVLSLKCSEPLHYLRSFKIPQEDGIAEKSTAEDAIHKVRMIN